MTELNPNLFPRRKFLQTAAGVAGVVALGWDAGRTEAAAPQEQDRHELMLAVAYWNGARLIDARHLPSGEAALIHSGVRLRVHGHEGGESLRALNAYYLTQESGHVPYHAWQQSALSHTSARFTMPVLSGDGILLSARHEKTETFGRLHTNAAPGQPKLRTGIYVLAVGLTDWTGYHFDPQALAAGAPPLIRRTLRGFVPASFGYRILTVESA